MSDKPEKYPDTPNGWYRRWSAEFSAAKKTFARWHKEGDRVVRRFLDDRRGDLYDFAENTTRLNLFHSNITTLMSMLYGRIPKVEVDRRFADADDDTARVAGEILSRMLNTDIEEAGEDVASVFRNCLQDRLLPGLGTARVKYEFEQGKRTKEAIMKDGVEMAPAVEEEYVKNEWVDIIYTFWKDVLWSPCRTYGELRWKAFRNYMTREQVKERFKLTDQQLDQINFSTKSPLKVSRYDNDDSANPQAEIWEIWDKIRRKVFYYTEGFEQILEQQDDPLELEGFWPDPPPMIANLTTTKYLPRSDFALAQDLYNEIDELETRITWLTRACKAVGVYDKTQKGVERMLSEGVENDLIPVDNWAMFAEKNGIAGVVNWMPLADIVNAVDVLTQKQNEKIQKLYQVTGMNDIMRGAATAGTERISATQRQLEANYGSIRIEALQNEFSRWVSDLQSLKAEIIAKHFEPYCIIQQSNIMATPDAQYAEAAIQLIKNPASSRWRITVRPETLAIADYAQLKQERTEYIMGLSQFLQSAAPMLEQFPQGLPFLMKLMKWGMTGFRGSNEIEGVVDQAITAVEKTPPPEKPDPAAEKAKMEMQKMQMEMQMEQQKQAAETQRDRETHQADMQLEQMKMQLEQQKMKMELYYMEQKFELELQAKRMELGLKAQEQRMEAQANAQEQAAQFAFNTAEKEREAQLNERQHQQDMEHSEQTHQQTMEQTKASGKLSLEQQKAEAKLKPKGDKK